MSKVEYLVVIATLAEKGVAETTLNELAMIFPDQGEPLVNSLLTATDEEIQAFNEGIAA